MPRLFCFSSVHCHNKTNWYDNKKKITLLHSWLTYPCCFCWGFPAFGKCYPVRLPEQKTWLMFMDEVFDHCHFSTAPTYPWIDKSICLKSTRGFPSLDGLLPGNHPWSPGSSERLLMSFLYKIILLLNDQLDNSLWKLCPLKRLLCENTFSAPSVSAHIAYRQSGIDYLEHWSDVNISFAPLG